ncbi:MAG: hypothetical protein JWO12_2540 [Frankiales bacterium]|nr:hypothetical protein [Frankiales bacterium]
MPERRPDPEPLETNDVVITAGGAVLWAVAHVVLLVLKAAGSDIHDWWLGMCAYGVALGVFGVRFVKRRERAIARDRAA